MYERVSSAIHAADTVAVFMHVRPDGDSVGSALAAKKYLENLSKEVDVYVENRDELRKNLAILPGFDSIGISNRKKYDLGIALDTATASRLGAASSGVYFSKCAEHILIDHHAVGENFAAITVKEAGAASTTQILYKIFAEHDRSAIDRDVATCLYAGLVTDSGALTFSNTSEETLRVALELSRYGVDRYTLVQKLFKAQSKQVFDLKLRVLSRADFFADGRCGMIVFRKSDFAATGTTDLDTEGIINNIIDIEGVSLAIAASEKDPNCFQVSVRAKDGVNAAAFTELFGGGGHVCAAGCRIFKGGDEAIAELKSAAERFLSEK